MPVLELLQLPKRAIEAVDVHVPIDARHTTIARMLPERPELPGCRYSRMRSHRVVRHPQWKVFQARVVAENFIDERRTGVDNRLGTKPEPDAIQPGKNDVRSLLKRNTLPISRIFEVQHRLQISLLPLSHRSAEVIDLRLHRYLRAEVVISTAHDTGVLAATTAFEIGRAHV